MALECSLSHSGDTGIVGHSSFLSILHHCSLSQLLFPTSPYCAPASKRSVCGPWWHSQSLAYQHVGCLLYDFNAADLFLCIEWREEHCYAKVGKRVATVVHSWSSMSAALQRRWMSLKVWEAKKLANYGTKKLMNYVVGLNV